MVGEARRATSLTVFRFLFVGAANTGVDVGAFSLLMFLAKPVGHAVEAGLISAAAWFLAAMVGRALHERVTFRAGLPLVGFYAVTTAGLLVQVTCTVVGSAVGGVSGAFLGKAVGLAISGALRFMGYRWISVHPARKGKETGVVPRGQLPPRRPAHASSKGLQG